MTSEKTATPRDIVLVGAGHAHVSVLRAFGMRPVPGVTLTLVTRLAKTPYSGMLPGLIAGHYAFDDTHIDTEPLCRYAGAQLCLSEVVGLDLVGKLVLCSGRPPVPFDVLSINIGSTPNTSGVKGAAGNVIPVKPIDGFLSRFDAARRRILDRCGGAAICVVGAGAGGVELLASIERRLRRAIAEAGFNPAAASFTLCTAEAEILTGFPRSLRRRLRALLEERGVTVLTDAAVTRIDGAVLHFEGRGALSFDEVFWTTEASAAPWLLQTGLKLNSQGFIETRPTLESVSHPGVFAAGDVLAFHGRSLPKAGVYAVRQGPVLAENLRRTVLGKKLKAYTPQRNVLFLISTGERYAFATRNGIVLEGAWVWRWKDWIDRAFMRKFKELPPVH